MVRPAAPRTRAAGRPLMASARISRRVDLEMSGLDLQRHRIVEMACVVTDWNLRPLDQARARTRVCRGDAKEKCADSRGLGIAQGLSMVLSLAPEDASAMTEWCKETFAKSGLLERSACAPSALGRAPGARLTSAPRAVAQSKVTTAACEEAMLSYIASHTRPGKSPLAGNSVHVDRQFLLKEMPRFMAQLHYRIVDVSSLKELAARWAPDVVSRAPVKKAVSAAWGARWLAAPGADAAAQRHRALDDIFESIEELRFYRSQLLVPAARAEADARNS